MSKEVITIQDFKRIFETIYSVLTVVGLDPKSNCTYFSMIGSLILHEHYSLNAKSWSGFAAYMLNSREHMILCFGEQNGESVTCSQEKFHSWVEVGEWAIDFMSPIFSEMALANNKVNIGSAKMFQKKVSEQASEGVDFKTDGDFILRKDQEISKNIIDMFASNEFNIDILNLCCSWFTKPPQIMAQSIDVQNQAGEIISIPLKTINLNSKW